MNLGDKTSRYRVVDGNGEVLNESGVATTRKANREKFSGLGLCWMVLEVGPHSPWVSRLLAELEHEVIVANPRQKKLISESSQKSEAIDTDPGALSASGFCTTKAKSSLQ